MIWNDREREYPHGSQDGVEFHKANTLDKNRMRSHGDQRDAEPAKRRLLLHRPTEGCLGGQRGGNPLLLNSSSASPVFPRRVPAEIHPPLISLTQKIEHRSFPVRKSGQYPKS